MMHWKNEKVPSKLTEAESLKSAGPLPKIKFGGQKCSPEVKSKICVSYGFYQVC